MIRTHRGRGGLMAKGWMRPVGLSAILVAALVIGGCSSKKEGAGAKGASGGAGANGGLGQEGMGGSSLQLLQKGSLGSEVQGPLSDIHFAYNESTVQPQDSDILKT